MRELAQGDILSVEKMSMPVLVVSKDYFNKNEQAVVCPFVNSAKDDPLHITINTNDINGIVLCEQMKLLDFRSRSYKKISELSLGEIMNVTDAIQGIFDYYPYGR